jgi:NAD(P)-dependent dehydrogenase (short-subunit alcohol dehydrogenase family)
MTPSFIKQLPTPETQAKIVSITSAMTFDRFPSISAYAISKSAVIDLIAYVAIENPNVLAVALHPSIVATDMIKDLFRPFALDTPELVGGVSVWLAGWEGADRKFLNGRYLESNWDAEDLVKKEEEIEKDGLLQRE